MIFSSPSLHVQNRFIPGSPSILSLPWATQHNCPPFKSTTMCSICLAHLSPYSIMTVLGVKGWCIRGTSKEGQLQLPWKNPKEWRVAQGNGVPLTKLSKHSRVNQNAHYKETQATHMSEMSGKLNWSLGVWLDISVKKENSLVNYNEGYSEMTTPSYSLAGMGTLLTKCSGPQIQCLFIGYCHQ